MSSWSIFKRAAYVFAGLQLGFVPTLADGGVRYIDSHIHLWTLPRTDGSNFPVGCCGKLDWLNRDFTVDAYRRLPSGREAVGLVLVESVVGVPESGLLEANEHMLRLAEREPLIVGVIGRLDLQSDRFVDSLEALCKNPFFRGLRVDGEGWGEIGDLPGYVESAMRAMADRNLVLESYRLQPGQVAAIASKIPENLVVVLDHFAGKGQSLEWDAVWAAGIEAIAPYSNIHVKVSDWQRMSGSEVGGAWPVPFEGIANAEAYRRIFRFLLETLGSDRLLFGTNWPVSDLAGPFAQQISILETLLNDCPLGTGEKIFRENALRIYGSEGAE